MAVVLRKGYTGGSSGFSSGTSKKANDSLEQTQEKGVLTTTSEKTSSQGSAPAAVVPTQRTSERRYLEEWDYTPSAEVTAARSALQAQEANKPEVFQSKYEGAVQSILDGILNREKFDVTKDANYNRLYELAKQRYQQNASRAMRDTMANANAATGGYGSTYSQAVGQQAYDRTMEGMNDQNLQLMQLAYQMYQNDLADRYNQLGAVQNVDNVDYGRYRDTVSDYHTDRNYYRQRLLDEYGIDYGQYMDSLGQANSAEEFQRAQDASDLAQGNWYEEMLYRAAQDAQSQQNYEREWETSQYQQALAAALQMAGNGMTVPQRYADQLDADTLSQLNALATRKLAASKSGGSGRGGSWQKVTSNLDYDWEDVIAMENNGEDPKIIQMAYQGLSDEQKGYYDAAKFEAEKRKASYVSTARKGR